MSAEGGENESVFYFVLFCIHHEKLCVYHDPCKRLPENLLRLSTGCTYSNATMFLRILAKQCPSLRHFMNRSRPAGEKGIGSCHARLDTVTVSTSNLVCSCNINWLHRILQRLEHLQCISCKRTFDEKHCSTTGGMTSCWCEHKVLMQGSHLEPYSATPHVCLHGGVLHSNIGVRH